MSKRTLTPIDDGTLDRSKKRQRIVEPAPKLYKNEEKPDIVYSSSQLKRLLGFHQGEGAKIRRGIQSFKVFLESILYPADEPDVTRQLSILKEFLDEQRTKFSREETPSFLTDLFQCWSYASNTTNDGLTSAVIAVLALLLKTIADRLDFREHGLLLCRAVLQSSHTKLLFHSLSAPKHKEHLISPSLRLLTEVVSFDAGVLAKQLYNRRDFTFEPKTIGRSLSMWGRNSEGQLKSSKPTVRSNAVRYVLANLKYQNEGVKIDILKQGVAIRALIDYIKEDAPSLACEILSVIKTHVLFDSEIPRFSKGFLLTARALTTISSLYRSVYVVDANHEPHTAEPLSVQSITHDFLRLVCTDTNLGVVHNSFGWYPPSADKQSLSPSNVKANDRINLGADLDVLSAESEGFASVRNGNVASFLQNLKPYSYELEMDLVLATFESTPELVADYFRKKAEFAFDPKVTSTWIGYATFLYSVIMLPIPEYFGLKHSYGTMPPPANTVIESIIPLPLTTKVLARCLNMDSNLTSLFAIRLLIIAHRKLRKVLSLFEVAKRASRGDAWDDSAKKLVDLFCLRIPKMKDVVTAFQRIPSEQIMQREAITRLLAQYYDTVPQMAFDAKFNCSLALAGALIQWSKSDGIVSPTEKIRLLELNHLTQIAITSPDMNWWHKPDALRHSPFITLLELVASSTESQSSTKSFRRLITTIVEENEILQSATNTFAVDGLIASIQQIHKYKGEVAASSVLGFLDDSVNRLVRKPIKYIDDLDALKLKYANHKTEKTEKPLSLLIMPLFEQWQYRSDKKTDTTQDNHIAEWLNLFLTILSHIGENEIFLSQVRQKIVNPGAIDGDVTKKTLQIEDGVLAKITDNLSLSSGDATNEETNSGTLTNGLDRWVSEISMEEPPEEDRNHHGLNKWMQHDVEEIIEEGHAEKLLLCLCSQHPEIRRQALINVAKFSAKVENSTYEEWEQVDLLLGQTIETSKGYIESEPLPYVAGVFASRAIVVLADPTHHMYPKINEYLNRGPSWNVERLPSYWADKIILNIPSDDNAYHKEVEWYVEFLFDCLRTPKDMEIFRSRGIFERILSLYSAPSSSSKLKNKIIRIIFRAAAIDGGSTTLITRFGVLGWVEGQLSRTDRHEETLKTLKARLRERCDISKVDEWSGAAIPSVTA